ncbi:MAG: hypothetical protein ACYC4R_00535 [Anaerolineae bacterium]
MVNRPATPPTKRLHRLDATAQASRGAIGWLVRETLGNLILIALPFGLVGRWGWWPGWALSDIYIV